MHTLIELTNKERIKNGLAPLKASQPLTQGASNHAQDMQKLGYFRHTTPNGQSYTAYTELYGYPPTVGENLYQGDLIPRLILQAWLSSPGHRMNILAPEYQEIGVGVVRGEHPQTSLCVQILGYRENNYPIIINDEAYETNETTVRLYIYGNETIRRMRFSEDGIHYSEWQPYQKERTWELSGKAGLCSVYVQLDNGKEILTNSDTIFFTPASGSLAF